MSNEAKLSFGVVTYNSAEDLAKLLVSLNDELMAWSGEKRIYIVDNGSTDSTLSVIKMFQNQSDVSIELVDNKKNLGFGGGHNEIIKMVTSDVHFIVNPDIVMPNNGEVSKIVAYFKSHLEVGLISPQIQDLAGNVQLLNKYDPTVLDMIIRFLPSWLFKKRKQKFVKADIGYKNTQPIEFASGAFMAFRTTALKKIGGFDSRYFMYFEDADITRKIRQKYEAVYYPGAVVAHRWQRASHHNLKMFITQVVSMIKYFNKWGWQLM
ncbi:glycosyltransferase family 2 protein [Furfurilactobacillus sp. WILCCON 0119]